MPNFTHRSSIFEVFGLRHLFTLMFIACSGVAYCVDYTNKHGITENEFRLLPSYCPDTQGFTIYGDSGSASPRAGYWISLMGESFWHLHHYCLGLLDMNRARRAGVPRQKRTDLWGDAAANMDYVIRNATANFILLPEVYTRLGEAELQLAHPDKANAAFARARALKPDYWPAYSHWAEFLIRNGQRQEAMKIVTSGLQHAPAARVLLEQYRTLGGKPSDLPKPVDKPQPSPAEADAEHAVDNSSALQKETPDEK